MKKITTYVLMVCRNFPATHPRKGQQTYFPDMIYNATKGRGIIPYNIHTKDHMIFFVNTALKIHTIRQNYPLWEKRMKKIQSGEAVLSICVWALPGGRWNKKNTKIEIVHLGKDDEIGIQKLKFEYAGLRNIAYAYIGESEEVGINIPTLANNDGLDPIDFKDWFNGPEPAVPLAIIHFTKYRY